MSYAGFYINLDHRADRRAEIEAELARHGLSHRYRRFAAVNGNALGLANPHLTPGEMGCFSSHYMLLKENLDLGTALHVIEDDIFFAKSAAQAINNVAAQSDFAGCDIVYTDIFMPVQVALYKTYKAYYDATPPGTFNIINMDGLPFGSTSSYLVNPASIRTLHDLYAAEIAASPKRSNDLFIRDLCYAGVLKVGCIFPFVTTVNLDHIIATDIAHDYLGMSALAAHLGRYSFFADADLNKARQYLDKFLPLPQGQSAHAGILNHLLAFSLTDKYKSF